MEISQNHVENTTPNAFNHIVLVYMIWKICQGTERYRPDASQANLNVRLFFLTIQS
ncbi:MAG: hypothetical protein LBC74_03105 [Planctomycetaceae bacterium]|nr:hypothetical protein [Planctomycetaceae bacterium]